MTDVRGFSYEDWKEEKKYEESSKYWQDSFLQKAYYQRGDQDDRIMAWFLYDDYMEKQDKIWGKTDELGLQ